LKSEENKAGEFMRLTIVLIFLLAATALPIQVLANGVGWTPGLAGTTPGPAKQKSLYLEEEHVTMEKDGVIAKFTVVNPTNKAIRTEMGFPLQASWTDPDNADSSESQNRCEETWTGQGYNPEAIEVQVNGEEVPYRIDCPKKGDYTLVLNWTMTFPPGKKTEFTVNYPLISASTGMDNPGIGSKNIEEWSYIVRTGAYWSRPIGKARFEFCGEAAALKCDRPIHSRETKWSTDGYRQVERSIESIKPVHSAIDCEKKCIVWERKNWVPKKDDDISVRMTTESSSYNYFDGTDAGDYFMKFWCGKEAPNIEGIEPKQFGSISGVSSKLLNPQNIESVIVASYVHSGGESESMNGDWSNPFFILPEHLAAEYGALLFRYLRNWIVAKHGHQFKDPALQACFAGIETRKEAITPTERKNIDFLQGQEKLYVKTSKKAWEAVKSNLLPENETDDR
jgi:hypothetical protein